MNDKLDRLLGDLDETQRRELGDIAEVGRVLAGGAAPETSPAYQRRLLAALEPYLSGSASALRQHSPGWFRIAMAQVSMFEASFWLAGGLVLLLGLLISVIDGRDWLPLAFLLLAPLLAAGSVAYAFRPATHTLGELERLSAVSPAELLFTRLALVLAFNLGISLALILLIWLEGAQVVMWRLALAWLGPMLALAGLALITTARWGWLAGTLLPLGIWGAAVLLGWREAMMHAAEAISPGGWLLAVINFSNPLLAGSLMASLLGIGLLGWAWRNAAREEHLWS